MKKLLTLLLIITFQINAQEPDCEEGYLESIANQFALPNCLNSKDRTINTDGCSECAKEFKKRYTGQIPSVDKKQIQQVFVDVALKEYKKNLTDNLLNAVKLATLPSTGADFNRSINACKMKTLSDFAKNCQSPTAIAILENSESFKNMDKELSNELAKILSTDSSFNPSKTLITRQPSKCFIPEKQILYARHSAIEELITPELINFVKNLDPNKFQNQNDLMNSLIENFDTDYVSIIKEAKSHLIIGKHFEDPKSMIHFFRQIKDPLSVNNLRELIYNKQTGEEFDKNISKTCEDSFRALKGALCSDQFEKGNIDLNPFDTYSKISKTSGNNSLGEYADTDEKIGHNIDVIKYCPKDSNEKNLSLLDQTLLITGGMNEHLQKKSLEVYVYDKHEVDIKNPNNLMCSAREKICEEPTFFCKMSQKYKNLQDENSLDYKLANTSNPVENTLLRSMIGDHTRIEGQTREILIASGIIPKSDGTLVAQPDIPERKPEFFQKQANNQQVQVAQAQTKPTQALSSTVSRRNSVADNVRPNFNEANYNNLSDNTPSKFDTGFSDLSDMLNDSSSELKRIQDEIARRMGELPGKRPTSSSEAKKLARDSFNSHGRQLSPQQEDMVARAMMSPQSDTIFPLNHTNDKVGNNENGAQVSGNDISAQEKIKKEQREAALMGMAGAQAVASRDIASEGSSSPSVDGRPKDLTKVALNIQDDPKIKLSELFNSKISQNDSETQLLKVLLRNKNNFILQLKDLNFKVIFNPDNSFNLLFESGDQKEAERMRPQLEMFLKKLKT